MAYDLKYGSVQTAKGTIGVNEPVVVFRAQDRFLPYVMEVYRLFCEMGGSPQGHLDLIDRSLSTIRAWQAHNQTQTPQSAGLVQRMDGSYE